jgi:nucleoside-diphosphate-sugar epimerase
MEVVMIRPPLVYGPGVKGNFASMIDWVRRGIPLPLGGIKNHRSLVGIDNLVDLVAICCDPERSPQAANEVFLVSDGEDISTPNLLKQVARVFGTRIWLLPIPEGFLKACARMTGRSAAVERLLGNLTVDCSKTQKLLGWYPATTLVEQLRKMAINVADS